MAFAYSDRGRRYHTYDYALRMRYGCKVARVPLDGGFSCPNLDGTVGYDGCSYCSSRGSGDFCAARSLSLPEQYEAGRAVMRRKWGDTPTLPYFQNFTNTYAPVSVLQEKYEAALRLPGAVGLCIATRADCLPPDVCALLGALSKRTYLTVELGLQTVHNKTAQSIGRGHDYAAFLAGYEALRAYGIETVVHLINGLPGEDTDMMLQTAKAVGALHPWGVKLHMLQVLRGTRMEAEYRAGRVPLLSMADYVGIVGQQLTVLPASTVICRISADSAPDALIEPLWTRKKLVVQNELDKWLRAHDTVQGACCKDERDEIDGTV